MHIMGPQTIFVKIKNEPVMEKALNFPPKKFSIQSSEVYSFFCGFESKCESDFDKTQS